MQQRNKILLDKLNASERHEINKAIGKKVRQYRKGLGLTQQELAERSGVSQSQISKLEKGFTIEIGAITLTKIGLALDLYLTPWWMD